MAVLAVDIGGSRTRALLLRERPGAGTHETMPQPVEMAARAAGQALHLDDLLAFLGGHCDRSAEPIEAVGVSVAGVLGDDRRTVRQALNVGWRDVPLAAVLGSRFRCPVVLDTDAFAAARAELRLGAGRRLSTFLYVTIGTGIGHALILDHRLWRGVHGAASTFGHLKTHADAGVPVSAAVADACASMRPAAAWPGWPGAPETPAARMTAPPWSRQRRTANRGLRRSSTRRTTPLPWRSATR